MKIQNVLSALSILILIGATAFSQELVREQPVKVEDSILDLPVDALLAFNGTDHAAFYPFNNSGGPEYQFCFRRLRADGTPFGSRKTLIDNPGMDWPIAADWDGSAYVVAVGNIEGKSLCLLRVSKKGKLLARVDIAGTFEIQQPIKDMQTINYFFLKVVGDTIFFCFSEGPKVKDRRVVLLQGPRNLIGQFTTTTLPKGSLSNAHLLGMTYDTEGFLALLGARDTKQQEEYEIEAVRLLRIDFGGNVVGSPMELEEEITPSISIVGPVFFGDGYMILYTLRVGGGRNVSGPVGATYAHYSLVIDDEGKTLIGPTDVGQAHTTMFFRHPIWNGSYVASLYATTGGAFGFLTFNTNGLFLTSPIIIEYFQDQHDIGIGFNHVFSGLATTFVYTAETAHHPIYMLTNQVGIPNGITKPRVVYFAAGDAEVGNNEWVIVWSAIGCEKVSIKGKGVKLRRLPPVGCAIVQVPGKKLKLTLTAIGPGGKAKRKIFISP